MVSLDQLLNVQEPSSPQFSPDGKYIVYSTSLLNQQKKGEHAKSSIWLAKVGEKGSARQLTSGEFNDVRPRWAPDGAAVAFVSDRGKVGKGSALWLLRVDGIAGEPVAITFAEYEQTITGFSWSPDGKNIAFISADEKSVERKRREEEKDDVQVYGEEWEFGRLRMLCLATGHVDVLFEEKAHVLGLTWDEGSERIAFVTAKTPELNSPFEGGVEVRCIGVRDRKVRTVYQGRNAMRNLGESHMVWVGDELYFLAGASPRMFNTSLCLYKCSVANGREWTRVMGGEEDCVTEFVKSASGTNIFVKVSSALQDFICTLDGTRIHTSDSEIRSFHVTQQDGIPLVAFVTGSTNQSLELYTTTSTSSSDLIQLSNHGAWLTHPVGNERIISIPSLDKTTTLNSIFISPPRSTPGKPHPTMVIIHGGPYGRISSTFTPEYGWSTLLLSQGFAVLHPNYRGGLGHGEAFASQARGKVGTIDYDDILVQITHLIDTGDIDPSRIIVGGWSQGGFLSYLCCVRNGTHPLQSRPGKPHWRFRGAICGAGVTFWNGMAIDSDLPTFECELMGSVPWDQDRYNCEAERRASALFEMREAGREKRMCDCLLLHGEKDERVPLHQARGFARGLRYWSVNVDEVTYPREGHLIKERAHVKDMLGRVVRFCDLRLK